MKSSEFKVVEEARLAAQNQLKFYNEMMNAKEQKMNNESNDKKLFVVDTIVTFRKKYVIEAESLEHAYDEVCMVDSGADKDYFEPVTSRFLGETIIDGRKISKKKFNKLLAELEHDKKEDSSYWMGEELIRKIDYDR